MTIRVVQVENLHVQLAATGDEVVQDINFWVDAGEVVALVGESGCGKTTVALALLGYARRGATIAAGRVLIEETDVLTATPGELRNMRGATVAYIPQDPAAALNPALRIRDQIHEVLSDHAIGDSDADRQARIDGVLAEVSLPAGPEFLARYPHQLSGGQLQRVCIAIAFICQPKVVVCDEPTTGLDVTTQAQVLKTLRRLCRSHAVAAVYVSHDLGVVSAIADRVIVLYGGRVAESGTGADVFTRSAHPYTRGLLAAVPEMATRQSLITIPGRPPAPGRRGLGCVFAPRCAMATDACVERQPVARRVGENHDAYCLRADELTRLDDVRAEPRARTVKPSTAILTVEDLHAGYRKRSVLHGVSLDVRPGECLALVGESGCGKTTLARAIVGLNSTWTGDICFRSERLDRQARARPAAVRQALQYIFQSPYSSLNSRRTVGDIIRAPLEQFYGFTGRRADGHVKQTLERVNLDGEHADRYPDELSGGERQRVAIARALACDPAVLICDEITSALDVSVQAAIVELLQRLRDIQDLAMLFVTHNLPLVRTLADRVAVMKDGRIVECASCEALFSAPEHPYTRELIGNTPKFLTGPAQRTPA